MNGAIILLLPVILFYPVTSGANCVPINQYINVAALAMFKKSFQPQMCDRSLGNEYGKVSLFPNTLPLTFGNFTKLS